MITDHLVEATRHKIADAINGILGKKRDRKGYERSPSNLQGDRLEAEIGHARSTATVMAGIYMAHARRELSYDEIARVLEAAGGDPVTIQTIRPTLVDWREGGHVQA